jgi:hypothetical protein
MIRTSAARRLAHRRATLEQRQARLMDALAQVNAEIAGVQQAERALYAPQNGKKIKNPIIEGLPITQKDRVLGAVLSRPKSGVTRQLIAEKLGYEIGLTAISAYLTQLRHQGLVRYENGLWYPAD